MTPEEAIKRGGHKHPEQIVEDLRREKFHLLTENQIEDLVREAYEAGRDRVKGYRYTLPK